MRFTTSRVVLSIVLACVALCGGLWFATSFYARYRTHSYCGRQGLGLSCVLRKSDPSPNLPDAALHAFTTSSGQPRAYSILQPAQTGPRPTVLVFHGVYGNGREAAKGSGLGAFAPEHGFVAVFPNALGGIWNAFPPGQAPESVIRRSAKEGLGDDVLFVRELVADLVRRGISDPKRVYLVGLSMGGFMALELACADANDFAGVGLIASSMPEVTGGHCQPSKPLPLLVLNGTADRSVPYIGGPTPAQYDVWGTDQTVAFFRTLDGCGADAKRIDIPKIRPRQATQVTFLDWTACKSGRVGLYRIEGGVHEFPPIGLDAAAALISFFNNKEPRTSPSAH